MNEEKKGSNETKNNENENDDQIRDARDPRKGQSYRDASEWERELEEERRKAEENKK